MTTEDKLPDVWIAAREVECPLGHCANAWYEPWGDGVAQHRYVPASRIAELEAKNADKQDAIDTFAKELLRVHDERDAAIRRADAAEKDAERYRWLRENCRMYWSGQDAAMEPVQLIHYEPHLTGPVAGWRERLDASIDAALAQQPSGDKEG